MNNIEALRREIDETDEKIAELFLKRLTLSRKIGEIKKEKALPVTDSAREEEILERLSEMSPSDGEYIKRLYKTVFEISKDLQDF